MVDRLGRYTQAGDEMNCKCLYHMPAKELLLRCDECAKKKKCSVCGKVISNADESDEGEWVHITCEGKNEREII